MICERRIAGLARVHASAALHTAIRAVTDIPMVVRAVLGPDAVMTKDGKEVCHGRRIGNEENGFAILTPEGRFVIPNQDGGTIVTVK